MSDTPYYPEPSATEMARMLLEDRLWSMTGLFEGIIDPTQINHVLDIGCGPGGWAIDVALSFPRIQQVTGIDISEISLAYASLLAKRHELPNLNFVKMNALEPLGFADQSVDLIFLRNGTTFVPNEHWVSLLNECVRICSPGGMMWICETDQILTTSRALTTMWTWYIQLLHMKHSPSYDVPPSSYPRSKRYHVSAAFKEALKHAGFQHANSTRSYLDISAESPLHESAVQVISSFFLSIKHLLIERKMITVEEGDEVYAQLVSDLLADDFQGFWSFVKVCGQVPPSTEAS